MIMPAVAKPNSGGSSIGISIARTCIPQYKEGVYVAKADPQPGDLVFFTGTYDTPGVSHVGIYVGNSMMIHCGDPITYANINTVYWQSHFYTYGRLP